MFLVLLERARELEREREREREGGKRKGGTTVVTMVLVGKLYRNSCYNVNENTKRDYTEVGNGRQARGT